MLGMCLCCHKGRLNQSALRAGGYTDGYIELLRFITLTTSSILTSQNVRPPGFEPGTCGLRVRCSAVELEALCDLDQPFCPLGP